MNNIILPNNLEERIREAVRFFWNTRTGQLNLHGDQDHGNRGAVTAGKQLDGFVYLVVEILKINGVPDDCIFTHSNMELPGYYRPNKKWDLLVIHNGVLLVAIEFKSHIGPSFGNNFNNRTEEAMGSAMDLWTAYREGVFGLQKAPWLGYFLLVEDCEKSSEPVKTKAPHFHVMDEFVDASYQKRYEIFCKKLILERKYASACFGITHYRQKESCCDFPNGDLSFLSFVESMLSAVLAHFLNWRQQN